MAKSYEIMERGEPRVVATNKKALRDFFVLQTVEAGIVLKGTEVKSVRQGKISLQEAYAGFPSSNSNDLYMINMHISPYEGGNIQNHEPKRRRKLLVNKREAVRLKTAVQEKGLTIIPLSVYFSGAFLKVELGVVKAKKKYDKREAKRKKEADKEMRRKFKY